VEERRRQLRLDLLEVPWDPDGREIVRAEMEEVGMTNDILAREMWGAGWGQSYSTLGRWLRGQSEPSATELGLLTAVLAGYAAGGRTIPGFLNPPLDLVPDILDAVLDAV
jgi:hypothetical protein